MKKIKVILSIVLILFINCSFSFATAEDETYDKFVDIPVPPKNIGNEYSQEITSSSGEDSYNTTAEDFINKSSNNYLKTLVIDGATIEPEFIREQTEYNIHIDKFRNKINIYAEADDERAKIDGTGDIKIEKNTKTVQVKVIAENGDINFYNLKVVENNQINYPIIITVIVGIILVIGIIIYKKR